MRGASIIASTKRTGTMRLGPTMNSKTTTTTTRAPRVPPTQGSSTNGHSNALGKDQDQNRLDKTPGHNNQDQESQIHESQKRDSHSQVPEPLVPEPRRVRPQEARPRGLVDDHNTTETTKYSETTSTAETTETARNVHTAKTAKRRPEEWRVMLVSMPTTVTTVTMMTTVRFVTI
ncbi:hypothetical protein QC764_105915 [Podospora pseudoanserina]|uniref:Uncharacterized protein n=1 Tax=Podospora pseudoanserina TaxID=2609844 RepID=A0ABR0IM90_9PEZI|nr:hypothetical protein QC764_105915 [Podospora pseudoanserina]